MTDTPVFSSTLINSSPIAEVNNQLDEAAGPNVDDADERDVDEINNNMLSPAAHIMNNVRNSPAKKKAKQATLAVDMLRSPHKASPKRKKAQHPKQAFDWAPERTKTFVGECIAMKNDLQTDNVAVDTWKSLSGILHEKHNEDVAWNLCREKFERMKEFFTVSMLPVEGIMSGKKWPFYDDFCTIFDIPPEYHSLVQLGEEGAADDDDEEYADEDDGAAERNRRKRLWTKVAVELLLDCYNLKKPAFDSSKSYMKHTLLYAEMSQVMKDYTINVNGKQCKSKMERLLVKFRTEYDKTANKTEAAPSKWSFYSKMLKMFKGSTTLEAPFASTVGRGLRFCENGVPQAPREGTRSIPAAKPAKQEAKKSQGSSKPQNKKATYKTWQQQTTEEKVEQSSRLVDEVHLLRITLENKRLDNKDFQTKLLQKL